MAKKEPAPERKVIVTIRSAYRQKSLTLDTWRYLDIVGELRWMGVDYVRATDAAKWCQRAKLGDINRVGDILMEVEVKDGETDKQKGS